MNDLDPGVLKPPEGFKYIAKRLEDHSFEAWAVGGSLRDMLLFREVRATQGPDWDVATNATPHEVIELFGRQTIPLGVEHGTVGVRAYGDMYEVTTFRRDVKTDGRHAVVAFADSIFEDLQRRDFTINALAWRCGATTVQDPHGGVDDARSGVLRAVGQPRERFREDYLRILRGLRFAGRFGLSIDPDTGRGMAASVDGLRKLSAERVADELRRILILPNPSKAFHLYASHGALDEWYPELVPLVSDSAAWDHALYLVDAISPQRPLLRLVRLLVSAGDSPSARRGKATDLLRRLRFSNADIARAEALSHAFGSIPPRGASGEDRRRWLRDVGPEWGDLFRLEFADRKRAVESSLVSRWRAIHREALSHPPLTRAQLRVTGTDLIDLGVPEGPKIRESIEHLLDLVLRDPSLNTKTRLLEQARKRSVPVG